MDTNDAIETAHAFPDATIIPLHCEGWAHFTQSRDDLEATFNALGFGPRLQLLEPGVATAIVPQPRSIPANNRASLVGYAKQSVSPLRHHD
jgi:hypothetical protein